jgi:hypothetical protein
MGNRLPYPSLNYFPRRLREEADPGVLALAAYLDKLMVAIQQEMLLESMWRDPARVPPQFLPELAYFVGVTLLNTDTDQQKRIKIQQGVHSLRYLSTWDDNIKPTSDGITGFSSSFYNSTNSSDWIMIGGSENPSYLATYQGVIGTNGVDLNTGLDLVGSGNESDITGIFLIDVGTSTLTADQVSQIVVALAGFVPCYMRIFMGYTSAGTFVPYAGGQIG